MGFCRFLRAGREILNALRGVKLFEASFKWVWLNSWLDLGGSLKMQDPKAGATKGEERLPGETFEGYYERPKNPKSTNFFKKTNSGVIGFIRKEL